MAERVLGPQWKQLSRRAGMIFAGTVLTTATRTLTAQTATAPTVASQIPTSEAAPRERTTSGAIPAVQLSFRVDEAIAGVDRGQVLTIREWAEAWSMHRPMSGGQHILIFLYPPSRLGLTSPVGGSLGQVELDASGKNVAAKHWPATDEVGIGRQNKLSPGARVPAAGNVSVVQLERAIRGAREE